MTSGWGIPTGKTFVLDDENVTVKTNEELIEKINEVAVDKGLSTFKVYVDDAEISEPEEMMIGDIPDNATIKVTPYDKASDDEGSEDKKEEDSEKPSE